MLSISIARRLRCRRDSRALRDRCVKGRRGVGKNCTAPPLTSQLPRTARRRRLCLQQHSSACNWPLEKNNYRNLSTALTLVIELFFFPGSSASPNPSIHLGLCSSAVLDVFFPVALTPCPQGLPLAPSSHPLADAPEPTVPPWSTKQNTVQSRLTFARWIAKREMLAMSCWFCLSKVGTRHTFSLQTGSVLHANCHPQSGKKSRLSCWALAASLPTMMTYC